MRLSGLLVLVLLAASPAIAEAECAWVLWERVSWFKRVSPPSTTTGKMPEGTSWILQAAVPTYAERNDAAKREAERRGTERTDATNVKVNELIGGGFSSSANVRNPDALMHVEVRCFPDTIDPRGPKGDGR